MLLKIFNLLFFFILSSSSLAQAKRIKSVYFDLRKPYKLELYAGLTTTIDFPCPITKVVPPPSKEIDFKIIESKNYELDLWLSKGISKPSSLGVRCEGKFFIFDIVPSQTNHTSYLKIIKAINPPLTDLSNLKLISLKNQKHFSKKKIFKRSYDFKKMKKIKIKENK